MAEHDERDGAPGGQATSQGAPAKDPVEELADHLLLALLTARRLPPSERKGRVEAGLLRVLIAEGASEEVAGFMAPQPAGTASFEVTVDEPSTGRTISRFGPDVESAVRDALRAASYGAEVQLVAVAGGMRRLVMRNSASRRGSLEFVPPDPEFFDGDAEACRTAIQAWKAFTADLAPSLDATAAQIDHLTRPAGGATASVAEAVRAALGQADIEIDIEAVKAAIRETLAEADMEVDSTAIQAAVRAALDDLTVTIDLADLEETVERAVTSALLPEASQPDDRTEGTGPGGDGQAGASPATVNRVAFLADFEALAGEIKGHFGSALTEALAEARKRITDDVTQAVARAVGSWAGGGDLTRRQDLADLATKEDMAGLARATDLEALARTIDLTELPRRADLSDLTELAARMEPSATPAEADMAPAAARFAELISRAVIGQLGPLLASRPTGPDPEVHTASEALLGAAEQLNLQMQSFDSRITASTRSLEALADELTARDRVAGQLTDQLARNTAMGFDRLAERLGSRLEELSRQTDQGAVSAELRSLNRRMNRILQVIDEIEGPAEESPEAP